MSVIEARQRLLDLDLGAIWQRRELLYFLVWRDVKVRYKQTAIGAAWAVLSPLLTVLIFAVVFGRLAKIPSDGLPYSVFAFAGFLPWTYFAQALARGQHQPRRQRAPDHQGLFPSPDHSAVGGADAGR